MNTGYQAGIHFFILDEKSIFVDYYTDNPEEKIKHKQDNEIQRRQ